MGEMQSYTERLRWEVQHLDNGSIRIDIFSDDELIFNMTLSSRMARRLAWDIIGR